MNEETYRLLASAASYWFLLLAALLVVKSFRCVARDNREEKEARNWSGGAGCVGELVVLEDGIRNKKRIKGARLKVPEEGLIGAGGIADIQIHHSDVRRKHVWFVYQPGQLRLKLAHGAQAEAPTEPDGTLVLRDGDRLKIGRLEMMMVFFRTQDAAAAGGVPPRRSRGSGKVEEDEYEDPFEENFWE